ncbi:hypothetical protein L9F63_022445, partial [Diploptera punctata]
VVKTSVYVVFYHRILESRIKVGLHYKPVAGLDRPALYLNKGFSSVNEGFAEAESVSRFRRKYNMLQCASADYKLNISCYLIGDLQTPWALN